MSLRFFLILTVGFSYLGLMIVFWRRTSRGPFRSRLIGGMHGMALGLMFLLRVGEAAEPAAVVAGIMLGVALIAAGLGIWWALRRPTLQNTVFEFWCSAVIVTGFPMFLFLRDVSTWFLIGGYIILTLLLLGVQLSMGKGLFEDK